METLLIIFNSRILQNMKMNVFRLQSSRHLKTQAPDQRFCKEGSGPAEILLNLIAVTILANPETLDAAKEDNIHT